MTRLRTTPVAFATLAFLCLLAAAGSPSMAMSRGIPPPPPEPFVPPPSFAPSPFAVSPSAEQPLSQTPAPGGPAYGTYTWPVVGPVINGFRPPSSPYGPGHRGIDIAVPTGTPVEAAAGGVVAFAGAVAGSLYVSIDHPDGVRTTYSYLSSIAVHRGDAVAQGDVVGASGHGHPAIQADHLHFGARFDGAYIDPLSLLPAPDLAALIRLAPLVQAGRSWSAGR